MEREDILNKAKLENKGKDLADRAAAKDGSFTAYFVGVILLILVDTVNGFVLGNVNRGADFALFSMACAAFVVKYVRLRKKHELITAIWWGLLALTALVIWVLPLTKVI